MKVPYKAHVALIDGERFVLMRNMGQPFEPKLEFVSDLDLELTNFSAGVRHQDPAGQRNGSTDIDELAHGAAAADWLNRRAAEGQIDELVIAAEPKILGELRKHVKPQLQAKIVGELPKNLTSASTPEIERAIVNA
jgi:protein required for attachment to host cells